MKKLIAMLLALTCVFGLVACGGNANNETPETDPVVKPASALEVLQKTWAAVAEDKKFPVMGGDFENIVDGAPGAYSLTDEGLSSTLLIPAEQVANVDEAASLIHAMMVNNFTVGAFHVTGDVAAFVEAMHTAITGNRWMCGMPEKLIIAVVGGEYVVAGFGINDAIAPFEAAFTATYPDAEMKCNEAITG